MEVTFFGPKYQWLLDFHNLCNLSIIQKKESINQLKANKNRNV